jgi:hypothetical protein
MEINQIRMETFPLPLAVIDKQSRSRNEEISRNSTSHLVVIENRTSLNMTRSEVMMRMGLRDDSHVLTVFMEEVSFARRFRAMVG